MVPGHSQAFKPKSTAPLLDHSAAQRHVGALQGCIDRPKRARGTKTRQRKSPDRLAKQDRPGSITDNQPRLLTQHIYW